MSFWQRKATEFLENEDNWPDRSYTIDWIVATAFWFFASVINASPVFKREFSVDDPLISHPHTQEQVPRTLNAIISVFLPLGFAIALGLYRRSLIETHHGLLTAWATRGLSRLITEFLKSRVGRLRPDFLARCKYDAALKTCTGNVHDILDGRRSFPSGHSSGAFAAMTFIALLIAGKTAAWCFSARLPSASFRASRLARLSLTLIPLFAAMWVAVTRVEDYRHHKEDVVVGSLIGILSAIICYLQFWPSPTNPKSFTDPQTWGHPRMLYNDSQHDSNRHSAVFGLTRMSMEDDLQETV